MSSHSPRARLGVLGLLLVTSTSTACGVRQLPPPPAPPRVVPEVPGAPERPPPEGSGRLLIDNEREPAKVSRVIDTIAVDPLASPRRRTSVADLNAAAYPSYGQRTELLCITPCAVDLASGAHTLVFTSMSDPEKTSSADVPVSRGTTVVRHDLGAQKPYTGAYVGGAALTLAGGGLTLIGGLSLAVGLTADPTVDKDGNVSSPKDFAVFGGVVGTVGLAALVTGILLMTSNRPEKRPGSTTTFVVER